MPSPKWFKGESAPGDCDTEICLRATRCLSGRFFGAPPSEPLFSLQRWVDCVCVCVCLEGDPRDTLVRAIIVVNFRQPHLFIWLASGWELYWMGPMTLLPFSSIRWTQDPVWFPSHLGGIRLVIGWMFCFFWGLQVHVEDLTWLLFIYFCEPILFLSSW